jgi:hypothetical protein
MISDEIIRSLLVNQTNNQHPFSSKVPIPWTWHFQLLAKQNRNGKIHFKVCCVVKHCGRLFRIASFPSTVLRDIHSKVVENDPDEKCGIELYNQTQKPLIFQLILIFSCLHSVFLHALLLNK